MTATSAQVEATSIRIPATVRVAQVLMVPLALMTGVGVTMFDIIPGAISGHTVTLLIAIAGYVGGVAWLVRRPQLGWRLALLGVGVHLGWGVLFKVVLEQDPAQVVFGAVQLAVLAALLAPSTRRHVRRPDA